ncbi:L-arabinose isomerase [Gilliamella sp. wkB108]|uniref:L-arabinose isomerase n=1 Tax=Gilliamella sp. wkB108 TaxID=3120256 RepID=UPI00080DF7CB|nr:L-arabinose isomerase [Gilliamella apicola]OCG22459.1 L-arabinose isomerase [Gilliamella apicola]
MFVYEEAEIWFVAGSQHLYGPEALEQIKKNIQFVTDYFNKEANLPIKIVLKPLATRPDDIYTLCQEVNYSQKCVGLITWLHTFSPAKMWINGLTHLQKPLLQLHTQFNELVPWDSMDMDFMNLNQTAHGGREFGFIGSRMRLPHSVVTGYWRDKEVHEKIAKWMRVCVAINSEKTMKLVRFGDNMREVAVTEGNKVSAQVKFGYAVNTHAVGDLVSVINSVNDGDVAQLIDEYETLYQISPVAQINGEKRQNLIDAARIELGIQRFLEQGGFSGFTTTFEDLHGMAQLPGLAVQRLMAKGYGFAGEGDWKTAALLRTMKVMAKGLPGGTAFMEDYTYDFTKGNELVIGSHMLEVCPSIVDDGVKPLLDIQPLGIGNKADPARLIFSSKPGNAINASLIDIGNRFRLVANELETIKQPHPLPKLPVACAVWKAKPSLDVSAEAWILAGAAHHSVYTQALSMDYFRLYAQLHNIELLVIDEDTKISDFRNELRWNEIAYCNPYA